LQSLLPNTVVILQFTFPSFPHLTRYTSNISGFCSVVFGFLLHISGFSTLFYPFPFLFCDIPLNFWSPPFLPFFSFARPTRLNFLSSRCKTFPQIALIPKISIKRVYIQNFFFAPFSPLSAKIFFPPLLPAPLYTFRRTSWPSAPVDIIFFLSTLPLTSPVVGPSARPPVDFFRILFYRTGLPRFSFFCHLSQIPPDFSTPRCTSTQSSPFGFEMIAPSNSPPLYSLLLPPPSNFQLINPFFPPPNFFFPHIFLPSSLAISLLSYAFQKSRLYDRLRSKPFLSLSP